MTSIPQNGPTPEQPKGTRLRVSWGGIAIPVAIIGADEAMRKGSPYIWPTTLQVRLGAPVETANLSVDDRDWLMDTVRNEMAAMLAAMREERAAR